ncbi:MAG: hypothetical protein HWE21_18420 [Cytophagia bacterium]|nr:hypothetical protein [Cytophagia bacterium]
MHQLTEKGISNLTEDEFENLSNLYFMECSIERYMQEFAPEDKRDHYYNSMRFNGVGRLINSLNSSEQKNEKIDETLD